MDKIDILIAKLNNGESKVILKGLTRDELKTLVDKMIIGGITVKACAYTCFEKYI